MIDLSAIKQAKLTLIEAESLTKVHWQALAAIWYRESNCRFIDNPFQFDPIPTIKMRLALLKEAYISSEQYTSISLNELDNAALLAACFLRVKCRYNLEEDSSEEAYADAFYGYNGRAYGANPLDSPYVANQLDDHHMDMSFRGTIDGKWIDIVDKRPGALTVYRQLVEAKI